MRKFRRFLVCINLLVSMIVGASELPAYIKNDFKQASMDAKTSNKNVLIVFSTVWCGPCKMMAKEVYPLKQVQEGLVSYEFVYVDAEKDPDLAAKYKIEAYPTFVVLSKDLVELGRFSSAVSDPAQFLAEVERARSAPEQKSLQAAKLSELDNKIESSPSALLYSERAEMKLSMEDYEAALDDFKKGAALDSGNKLHLQGNVLYMDVALHNGNDPKKMAEVCERVVSQYINCSYAVMARYNLVQIYGNFLKDNKKAEMHARIFVEDYPKHAAVGDVKHMMLHFTGENHEDHHH